MDLPGLPVSRKKVPARRNRFKYGASVINQVVVTSSLVTIIRIKLLIEIPSSQPAARVSILR